MNISAVNSSHPLSSSNPNQNTIADAQIRSLEEKIRKLNVEKQKAIDCKDKEQEKKIEKQIQEIKKQIQQLKQQEKETGKEAVSGEAEVHEIVGHSPDTGKYTDAYV